MAWKDPKDPRDPWAWRTTWTGEIRNDYSELWIIVSLIMLFSLLALLCIVPLFIHRYCRLACPCPGFWDFFDRFLQVLHELGRKRDDTHPTSFVNPAFDPELGSSAASAKRSLPKQNLSSVERSTRLNDGIKSAKSNAAKRSQSLPIRPKIPKLRI